MKKLIAQTLSFAASLVAVAAINGTSSAYASSAGKDVSSLNLGVVLKSNVFTYTGRPICPEYKLTNGETDWTSGEYKGTNYTIGYRYNINAGTGKIVAVGTGEYSGQETLATFTINPQDINDISDLKINSGMAAYTGKPVVPSIDVKMGTRTLKESIDYTVSAQNNTDIGYTTGSINFKGNYKGSRSIYYKIDYAPINHFTASQETSGNVLTWDSVRCDKINVYRWDDKSNTSKLIGTTTDSKFVDTTAPQFSNCRYYIQTQATYNGKQYFSTSKMSTVVTTLNAPVLNMTSENGVVTLSWNSNPDADGYLVYMDGMLADNLRGAYNTSYTVNNIDPSDKHKFSVSAYINRDGQFVNSPQSEQIDSRQEQSVLRKAKKGDRRSFKIFDTQKDTTSVLTVKLTDNDFAILEKFAKEHFTEDMTDTEKLQYTLEWINRNTKYAYGSDWNKIGGKSNVEAIFSLKLGQCLQYNGAMVSMMRYLGYEANLILGWRGTWPSDYWQHYWGEIEIDGTKYLIETGNYGKSGYWSFFLVPYNQADGKYIINRKNIPVDYSGWWWY